MKAPENPELKRVRHRHPGWSITVREGRYTAMVKPLRSPLDVITRESLADLDARLKELGRP